MDFQDSVASKSNPTLSILGDSQEKSCPRDRTTQRCWDHHYKNLRVLVLEFVMHRSYAVPSTRWKSTG